MGMGQLEYILSQEAINYLSVILPLACSMIGMVFAVAADAYISRRHKIILYHIIVLAALLIVQNNIGDYFPVWDRGFSIPFRTACSVLGYSIRPMILVLFLCMVEPDRNYRSEWLLVTANVMIYVSAFFSPLTFGYSKEGAWIPGPLRDTCLFISAVFLLELAYLTIRRYWGKRKREMVIPVFCFLLIVCSLILDYNTKNKIQIVSFLTIAIVVSSLFFYIWLHLQFVREHEEDLKAQQRIQIMISQIQPHFLFNTLSAVQALCDNNPHKAKLLLGKLGLYLRQNIASLNSAELIPFQKELAHTKLYVEIEKERYGDISVEFDARDTDFLLPPLTVQPMVENAIRHGIRGLDRGKVSVIARKCEHHHEIIVRDNGIGFDKSSLSSLDSTHIGIKNVKERIEKLCHGSMTVDSQTGEGTAITICIPCREKTDCF